LESRPTLISPTDFILGHQGISFLNVDSRNLVVEPTKTGRWGYKIGDRFGQKTYPTVREAKLALFDDFWAATQDNDQLWATD
jgi:hypothetical protein